MKVPFNIPSWVADEKEYAIKAMDSKSISGNGIYTKNAEELIESQLHGIKKAFLTTSCTHALEMSAMLLDIDVNDEVIVPAYTFVTSALAFVMRGAKPIFADIRPDTLNINENILESLITKRTKAIVVVHYAGVSCEMDEIMRIAKKYGLIVIEDNAHGLNAKYKGKYLGTIGQMATLSFHETKNITCGEGGALLLNDEVYVGRSEIIREKGTNRSSFYRGEVNKYTWIDIGSSYVLSDLLAAILFAQLSNLDLIQNKRRELWEAYNCQLMSWADSNEIQRPYIPEDCEQSYHMYYLVMPNRESRSELLDYLNAKGINAVFHYIPLNTTSMGQKLGGVIGQCPVSEDISNRLIRLPFFTNMSSEEQKYVIDIIQDYKVK